MFRFDKVGTGKAARWWIFVNILVKLLLPPKKLLLANTKLISGKELMRPKNGWEYLSFYYFVVVAFNEHPLQKRKAYNKESIFES